VLGVVVQSVGAGAGPLSGDGRSVGGKSFFFCFPRCP
jgi:hypothetical protein